MLEAWSEVDKDLAELNGNTSEFRLGEATSFVEAMNQEMAQTLFYGNSGTAPEEFTGLSIRYSSSTAASGQNVIKAGGSGSDNSSIAKRHEDQPPDISYKTSFKQTTMIKEQVCIKYPLLKRLPQSYFLCDHYSLCQKQK